MSRGVLSPRVDAPINWVDPVNWLHPLNRGLVGWWLCVPGAIGGSRWPDLCRRNYGTLTNMDPQADWLSPMRRPGGWGCLDFDGTNDYVDPNTNGFGTLVSRDSFSFSCWCLTRLAATRQTIMGDWSAGGADNSFLASFGGYKVTASNFGANHMGTGFDTLVPYSTNTWYHVAWTWNNVTDTLSFYLNGVLRKTFTLTGIEAGTSMTFGRGGDYNAIYTNGQLDDIRIHKRSLTDFEAHEYYNLSRQFYPGLLNRVQFPTAWQAAAASGGSSIFRSPIIRACNV